MATDAFTNHARLDVSLPGGYACIPVECDVVHTAASILPVPDGAIYFKLRPATNSIQFKGTTGEAAAATNQTEIAAWLATAGITNAARGTVTIAAGEASDLYPCAKHAGIVLQAVTGTCDLTVDFFFVKAQPPVASA